MSWDSKAIWMYDHPLTIHRRIGPINLSVYGVFDLCYSPIHSMMFNQVLFFVRDELP